MVLTIDEGAALVRVHRTTFVRSGVPIVNLGRRVVLLADLERWASERAGRAIAFSADDVARAQADAATAKQKRRAARGVPEAARG